MFADFSEEYLSDSKMEETAVQKRFPDKILGFFKKSVSKIEKREAAKLFLNCQIRDFFVFRDVLFARGFLDKVEGIVPRISVRLWNNEIHAVRYSDDDFFPTTADKCAFCFNFPIPPHTPAELIAKIGVVFDFPSGRFEKNEPSKEWVASDPFLNSEAGFWASVHAQPNANVLEIGSRARSGISRRSLFPATCSYTGFDILAGENVNCVGDAHALSRVLPLNHFDIVFSVSVWEHLCMPWLVSVELNKVMKIGGIAMINTHQSWPSHEEPWDYFRFSDFSWDSLFNKDTGFEIIDRGTGMPCVMGSSQFHPPIYADRVDWHYGYLATRCVAKKISETSLNWPVNPSIIVRQNYPH
jgi:hypothetical protein